jgi:hypothetical protein
LKESGVDGEVLSFVKSSKDLEELGITLPRAKYAVFVKNMKQFRAKGVPTSFLYDHPENKPFLSSDVAWDEIACFDFDNEVDDHSCHENEEDKKECIEVKPTTSPSDAIVSAVVPSRETAGEEDDLLAKISSLSLHKAPVITLLEDILKDCQEGEGYKLSDEAAAEACMQVTHYLLQCQNEKRRASLRLCLEIVTELCCDQSRAVTFCIKDEGGVCSEGEIRKWL